MQQPYGEFELHAVSIDGFSKNCNLGLTGNLSNRLFLSSRLCERHAAVGYLPWLSLRFSREMMSLGGKEKEWDSCLN